eukprot:gnl/Ergobibamus_cyprinoides/5357.p1 GENE.gnl/Ergobibamus_cyprinoides/5357~~gnl/Ergobibamus_cyprinoides/5357.p1  ORF type:complete len:138 (+),score=24.50 gnl/Ergobibamus_cyprinoides/5357:111-524(+)
MVSRSGQTCSIPSSTRTRTRTNRTNRTRSQKRLAQSLSDLQEPDADVTASDAGVDDSDMGASDALDGGSELDDDALAALGESSGVPTLAEMVAALIDEPDCRNRKLLHKLLNYMAILTFPQHAEASEAEASAADESS